MCPEWVWPIGLRTLGCVECQRQLGPGSDIRQRNSFLLAGLAQKDHLFLFPLWMPLNSNPAMPSSNSKNTQGNSAVVGLGPCDSLSTRFPGSSGSGCTVAQSPNVEIEFQAICCFGRKLWVLVWNVCRQGPSISL